MRTVSRCRTSSGAHRLQAGTGRLFAWASVTIGFQGPVASQGLRESALLGGSPVSLSRALEESAYEEGYVRGDQRSVASLATDQLARNPVPESVRDCSF